MGKSLVLDTECGTLESENESASEVYFMRFSSQERHNKAYREDEELKENEAPEEDDEPEEEFAPWTDYYEKSAPEKKSADNSGGYYQFCMVQFKEDGADYAYLTGGISLRPGDFVIVPVGAHDIGKLGRVTNVFVCSEQEAPYPPDAAKFALRKSERTAFPEKKTPQAKPEREENPTAAMRPVPEALSAKQPAPEAPASCETKSAAETSAFTLPPLPEREAPAKPRRRIPWTWVVASAAVIAFCVFALPPLERIAEANRQQISAQLAAAQEKREQEARQAEQARLEAEAAAQRRSEEQQARKQASIESLKNANLPYPGMPYDEISSTKLGKASKSTSEMRSGHFCYTLTWQIRDGDYLYTVFVATTENKEVLTAERLNLEYWSGTSLKGTIYHQPKSMPSMPFQNQNSGTAHGSNGLRDEYDSPEDLYEDNPDWFEDEDEAWDEWENG